MNWYLKVTQNLENLSDFLVYFEKELIRAKNDVNVVGNVEKNISDLPGITEDRFGQLQEIEAVLNYFNIQLKKIRSDTFRKYLENYNRELSSRDVDRYVDGDKNVIDLEILINEISLIRNKYLGIIKALESKNFMLGHITRLRTSGMNDLSL